MTQSHIAAAALAAYPRALQARGVVGTVRLGVRVDGQGAVTRLRVRGAEGDPAFTPVAEAATRGVRFLPADGAPGEEIEVVVTFEGMVPMRGNTAANAGRDMLMVRVEMNGRSAVSGRAIPRNPTEIVLDYRIMRGDSLVVERQATLRHDGENLISLTRSDTKMSVTAQLLPSGEIQVTFTDDDGNLASGTAFPGRPLTLTITDGPYRAIFFPSLRS